ncbi:ABC transporter substrate-binding protein [Sanguibacter antarcticus]|uniref:Thiamine pyrimidine synthase n=1 Tax=Sanguibacter antarcticus TaxID=372484 RepID=A0A2A9E4W4_9MICO|nr:ABC transporter substrate-binding protein [Sanguibacter antarcticus]PFG33591.1 NitT/TauT family transport system substrate-binding protein [Sanguibacter antarcticus]
MSHPTTRAIRTFTVVSAVAALTLAGCSAADSSSDETETTADGLTPVSLQLQWFNQGQFSGYIAARDKGFYEDAGLDVEILEGGVDIVPQTALANDQVDFAIAWVPKALASREQGATITDVAQIYQRSGTLQVAFAESGITTAADLAGTNVGSWGFGNEFELFAGMAQADLDPASDVTLVQQQFDMNALLSGDIDAAQAMTYNEYAQLLEAENPATGELYTPDDFSVVDWNDEGTAMLQDAIWANTERLTTDPAYEATTVAFVKASLQGWIYCRDNAEECRDMVVAAGSQLGASHQLWQVNEVNKLVWPSPDGIGMIDQDAWDQTVDIAMTAVNDQGSTVITAAPDDYAFTNEYVTQALDELEAEGLDTTGTGFTPLSVDLEAGGE